VQIIVLVTFHFIFHFSILLTISVSTDGIGHYKILGGGTTIF